jgi:tRNA1Val (adenine37-N6)-methyltransferase
MREHPAPDETLTLLCHERLKLLQKKGAYRFSLDPILLANFITLKRQERMLDIGTGCGIIPVYMSKRHPHNSLVGVEVQKELFDLAVRNVRLNGCKHVEFRHGDIKTNAGSFKEPFHVVVSNPPYVKKDSGRVSPQHSRHLARYESLLDLKSLIAVCASLLYTKGRLYLIYPVKRLAELISVATSHGLEPRRLRLIHPRVDRPANLFLIECMKGGGAELKVERPLYVYEDDQYTEEVASYYA